MELFSGLFYQHKKMLEVGIVIIKKIYYIYVYKLKDKSTKSIRIEAWHSLKEEKEYF